MEHIDTFMGPSGHWRIEDKRGRLVAFGLREHVAKSMVRGTSNRARRW